VRPVTAITEQLTDSLLRDPKVIVYDNKLPPAGSNQYDHKWFLQTYFNITR